MFNYVNTNIFLQFFFYLEKIAIVFLLNNIKLSANHLWSYSKSCYTNMYIYYCVCAFYHDNPEYYIHVVIIGQFLNLFIICLNECIKCNINPLIGLVNKAF